MTHPWSRKLTRGVNVALRARVLGCNWPRGQGGCLIQAVAARAPGS